jgi:23S rRNA (cytidine1920-2'-O)/16S rRNA (cytidine1409-2'-O)-methyltransferase
MRNRLDAELVRRNLARSREHAQDLIERGFVKVGGLPANKTASQVDQEVSITVELPGEDFVSRGGHKLVSALDAFSDVNVEGKRCLDAGASTGGFTDVLLKRGAGKVVAVDVGYGQLAWSLQQDKRVEIHDRTNIREISIEKIGGEVDLIVADLSFISLKTVPQFEVGRERLGAGGVVREPELREEAVMEVAAKASELGLGVLGVVASSLPGPSGNVEYFLWLKRSAPTLRREAVTEAIRKGPK